MYPLIEITTIPIEIEIKTTRAKLEYTKSSAEVEIARDKSGGVRIKSRPIQVSIDTFQARSAAMPTLTRKTEQSAASGKQTGYAATATFAQQGQLLLNGRIGEEMAMKYAYDEALGQVDPGATSPVSPSVRIQFLSEQNAEADWETGELNIRYEMDKLNFDWRANQHPSFEFTPGDIKLTITQRPEVLIKYVGGPIYVPPSADPNYEPLDVQV